MSEAIVREQIKKRDTNLSFGFGHSTIPGTYTIEAIHAFYPQPLAIRWTPVPRSEV